MPGHRAACPKRFPSVCSESYRKPSRMELRGTSGEIQLTVSDPGGGFDQKDSMDRRGLRLISMQERLQLVGGQFSVESKPGCGTTIRARVPFVEEHYRAAT